MTAASRLTTRLFRQLELQRSRRESQRTLRHLFRTVSSPAEIDEILARMETPARVWRTAPAPAAVVTPIAGTSLPLAA